MRDTVASQLIGHETARFLSLTTPKECPKESSCRTPVAARLYEDVDHVTVLVNRAPEILALAVDRDEDFVQKSHISESTLTSPQLPSVVRTKLRHHCRTVFQTI